MIVVPLSGGTTTNKALEIQTNLPFELWDSFELKQQETAGSPKDVYKFNR